MNKETFHMLNRLTNIGISEQDALALRHIAMTLHSWHERECGIDGGCIERDEKTGKAYWLNSDTMKRYPIADREKGALKRLNALMKSYPGLGVYIQGDPRGASLYIMPPKSVPEGGNPESYYSNGIAVYK